MSTYLFGKSQGSFQGELQALQTSYIIRKSISNIPSKLMRWYADIFTERVHIIYTDYYNNSHLSGSKRDSVHQTMVMWHGRKNLCLVRMRGQLIFIEYLSDAKCFIFSGVLEPACASSYGLERGNC